MDIPLGLLNVFCKNQISQMKNLVGQTDIKIVTITYNPIGLGTIPTGIRPENPRELTGKMLQNSGFITSHLKFLRNFLMCEVMNPEFWNIFPVSSRGFSGWIPVGIVPSPIWQYSSDHPKSDLISVQTFSENPNS